jgi:hypothetical protein
MLANSMRGILIVCYIFIGLLLLFPVMHATKEDLQNNGDEVDVKDAVVICWGTCMHIVLLSL